MKGGELMFYIREVRPDGCIVVDTDDGVAELASKDYIVSLIQQGIKILGVSFNGSYKFHACSKAELEECYKRSTGFAVYDSLRKTKFTTDTELMRLSFEAIKKRYDSVATTVEDLSHMGLSKFICDCIQIVCSLAGVSCIPWNSGDVVSGLNEGRLREVYRDCGVRIVATNSKADRNLYYTTI